MTRTSAGPDRWVQTGLEQLGQVSAFDDQVGLGQIRGADASLVGFHCVAILDGSRTIAVGATVRFVAQPGLHGRWEATAISLEGADPDPWPSSPR